MVRNVRHKANVQSRANATRSAPAGIPPIGLKAAPASARSTDAVVVLADSIALKAKLGSSLVGSHPPPAADSFPHVQSTDSRGKPYVSRARTRTRAFE